MTWARLRHAWERALYGPDGFYRTQSPRRHFSTSVAGVPGTVDVLADALTEFMRRHHLRTFIDLGAAYRDLASAMMARDPEVGAIAIDIRRSFGSTTGGPPAELDGGRLKWLELAPGTAGMAGMRDALAESEDALLFAHEWLDVVPCEIAEVAADGKLRYVLYDDRSATERLGEPIVDADLAWCRRHWPTAELVAGDRIEIGRARDLRWAQVTESLRSGVAIAVDFGHIAGERPRNTTLTGYRGGRAVAAVPDGRCDQTAQVAMDTLGAPILLDQRTVLADLGVVADPPDPGTATTDPLRYLSGLARSAAAAALLGPGYGDTWWAIGPGGERWSAEPTDPVDAATPARRRPCPALG